MKRFIKRFSCLLAALCFVFVICVGLMPQTAEAEATTLTIKAGYFGFPYVTKGELTASEIESLGAYTQLYTMNSRGNFLAYAEAYGTAFADILDYVEVNRDAISHFNFIAFDNHNASKDYYYSDIIGGDRYTFPSASQYYSRENGFTDTDPVWASAQRVRTMIALEDNFGRVDDYSTYEEGVIPLSSTSRYRLMIGQQYPGEVVASDSIQGVSTVLVTYSGSPSISADDVEFKIGEDLTIQATVSSEESELTQTIQDGLKYKSSDESIVKVDSSGKLTAVGKGTAQITIYYEYRDTEYSTGEHTLSKTINVSVGGDESGTGGSGHGSGSGDGTGDGTGGSGGGHGTGDGDGGTGGGSGGDTGDGGSGTGGKTDTSGGTTDTQSGDGGKTDTKGDKTDTGKQNQDDQNRQSNPDDQNNQSNQNKQNNTQTNTQTNNQTDNRTQTAAAQNTETDDDDTVYVTEKAGTTKIPGSSGSSSQSITVRRLTASTAAGKTGGGSAASGTGGSSGGTPGGSEAFALTIQSQWEIIAVIISSVVLLLIGGAGMYIKYRKEI